MNISAQQPALKFTPLQMAAQQYDLVKRKILKIDADGISTKQTFTKIPSDYHEKIQIPGKQHKVDAHHILSQLNQPTTQADINKIAKLNVGEIYLALKKVVLAGKALKLRDDTNGNGFGNNRFFYILIGKPYDTERFVEVVK